MSFRSRLLRTEGFLHFNQNCARVITNYVEAQSIIESLDNLESEIAVKDIPTILDKESTILIIEKLRNIRFVDAV